MPAVNILAYDRAMWILYAFLAAFFGGAVSVLAKVGLQKTDSTLVTALRTVVVMLLTWFLVLIVGSADTIGQINQQNWFFLIASGLTTGLSWLCYFKALQLGQVHKVVPLDKLSAVLTMLLAVLLLGETFTLVVATAIPLLLIGTLLMTHTAR